jgi:hypothetical protein
MIPKIIHYTWFSKEKMPKSQIDCIKTWKKVLPDYEIKKWDTSNFDVNMCKFSAEAYNSKKWAFVADVARLHILYNYGGIYMDTDVEIIKTLDSYLTNSLFTAIEVYPEHYDYLHLLDENKLPISTEQIFTNYLALQGAVIGATANNVLIKEALDYYLDKSFICSDGSFNTKEIIPAILAHKALKYGFRYEDKEQLLKNNMLILPSSVFNCVENAVSDETILIHHSAQSWVEKTAKEKFYITLDKYGLLFFWKKLGRLKRKILSKLK